MSTKSVNEIRADYEMLRRYGEKMAPVEKQRDYLLSMGTSKLEKVNTKQGISGSGNNQTLEFDLPSSQGFLEELKLYMTYSALTGGTTPSWCQFAGLFNIEYVGFKPQNQINFQKFGKDQYDRFILHYGDDELKTHGRLLGGYQIIAEDRTNSASARTFVISLSKMFNLLGGYFDLYNYRDKITIQIRTVSAFTTNVRGTYGAGGALTDCYLMMSTKIPKTPDLLIDWQRLTYGSGVLYKDYDVITTSTAITTSATLATNQIIPITNIGNQKVSLLTFHVIALANLPGTGSNVTNYLQINSWSLKSGSTRIDGSEDDITETVFLGQLVPDVYRTDGKKNLLYGYRCNLDGTNDFDGLVNSDTTRILPRIYFISWDTDIDNMFERSMLKLPGYIDMNKYGPTNLTLNMNVAATTGVTACTVVVNAYVLRAFSHKDGRIQDVAI
jgi:hypothetical protein